jgi:hypothetical protein
MRLALVRDIENINRIKINCVCGGFYTIYPDKKFNNKIRHSKTKRHKKYEMSVYLEINKINK